MSLIHDLRDTPRLGILVAIAAATVGIIYGYDGVADAYRTGRGRVVMRASPAGQPPSRRQAASSSGPAA